MEPEDRLRTRPGLVSATSALISPHKWLNACEFVPGGKNHMSGSKALCISEIEDTAPTPKDEAVVRLVDASFRNGSMTESQRAAVLKFAQWAGVTTWEFLRGRLLMQARLRPACFLDSDETKQP